MSDRDLEAQRAVPARRPSRVLLRHMDAMGLSRYLPVLSIPRGAAKRPPISAIAWKAFRRSTSRSGSRGADQIVGLGRRHAEGGRHIRSPVGRGASAPSSLSAVDPAPLRRRSLTARSWTRCSCSNGCGRSRVRRSWRSCASLPNGHRVDAGGDCQPRPRRHQAGTHRGVATGGDRPRADGSNIA